MTELSDDAKAITHRQFCYKAVSGDRWTITDAETGIQIGAPQVTAVHAKQTAITIVDSLFESPDAPYNEKEYREVLTFLKKQPGCPRLGRTELPVWHPGMQAMDNPIVPCIYMPLSDCTSTENFIFHYQYRYEEKEGMPGKYRLVTMRAQGWHAHVAGIGMSVTLSNGLSLSEALLHARETMQKEHPDTDRLFDVTKFCEWRAGVKVKHELATAEDEIKPRPLPTADEETKQPLVFPDSLWDEHPDYPMEDWVDDVKNGNTVAGYREWATEQHEL